MRSVIKLLQRTHGQMDKVICRGRFAPLKNYDRAVVVDRNTAHSKTVQTTQASVKHFFEPIDLYL